MREKCICLCIASCSSLICTHTYHFKSLWFVSEFKWAHKYLTYTRDLRFQVKNDPLINAQSALFARSSAINLHHRGRCIRSDGDQIILCAKDNSPRFALWNGERAVDGYATEIKLPANRHPGGCYWSGDADWYRFMRIKSTEWGSAQSVVSRLGCSLGF